MKGKQLKVVLVLHWSRLLYLHIFSMLYEHLLDMQSATFPVTLDGYKQSDFYISHISLGLVSNMQVAVLRFLLIIVK